MGPASGVSPPLVKAERSMAGSTALKAWAVVSSASLVPGSLALALQPGLIRIKCPPRLPVAG